MLRFRRGAKIAFAAGLASMTMACAAIDSVGLRGGAMDESVTQYRNEETLRNIVRGSKEEPLNFSAISSVTGHNTVTLGAPAVTWNAPSHVPSEAVGSTTANTAAYNFSNDFNWNQIDDNATTSALLTPLDAATMAIFFEYGYPPELLLLLFIHHIQIKENVTGKNGGPPTPGKVIYTYYSNRVANLDSQNKEEQLIAKSTLEAYAYLADYQGLTFRFERASIPGQQKKPRSQLCFDPETAFVNQNIEHMDNGLGHDLHNGHLTKVLRKFQDEYREIKAENREIKPPGTSMPFPPGTRVPQPPGIKVLDIANCDKRKSWIPASTDAAATSTNENYNCISSVCPPKKKPVEPEAVYRIYDPYDNVWLELFPRSTYSIYRLLGTLIDKKVPLTLGGVGSGEDQILFTVTKGVSSDCFTEIVVQEHYCVPQTALNTKAIFSILHLMAALYTFPSTAPPNSSTVRITP